jgi:benzoyl-CoA reductase/2-hydroxyglutaryl-CoA dehydratase subunit BcrC/BadD/HgdB
MRRTADRFGASAETRMFLLNVPATWQSEAARRAYREEIERLGRFLVRLGGRPPLAGELRQTVQRFESARAALYAARPSLSARGFSEAVARFQERGELPQGGLGQQNSRNADGGLRVALVGASLLQQHFRLFDEIEAAGGVVVLEATCSGEAGLLPPIAEEALRQDPFWALVDAYAALPAIWRRPNAPFYDWLQAKVRERSVRAVILRRYLWCDLWHAEETRLKAAVGLPLLRLDVGDESELLGHAVNRIQAFLETVK